MPSGPHQSYDKYSPPKEPDRLPLPRSTSDAFRKLQSQKGLTHPYLLLNKYVAWHEGWRMTAGNKDKTVKDVAYGHVLEELKRPERPALAQKLDKRRRSWLDELARSGQARLLKLTTRCNLAVNLSSPGPLELGLALDYVYGLPIIPGSALKGIAHAWARINSRDESVFGDTGDDGRAGAVDFLDAFWAEGTGVERDIMTPHNPTWYREGPPNSPNDRDNPVPIPFLSVGSGAIFAGALIARSGCAGARQYLEAALEAVRGGLLELGAGAKTAAGYGVIAVEVVSPPAPLDPGVPESHSSAPADSFASDDARRLFHEIGSHPGGPKEFGFFAQKIDGCVKLQGGDLVAVARLLVDKMGGVKELRKRAKDKPRYQRLLEVAGFGGKE